MIPGSHVSKFHLFPRPSTLPAAMPGGYQLLLPALCNGKDRWVELPPWTQGLGQGVGSGVWGGGEKGFFLLRVGQW